MIAPVYGRSVKALATVLWLATLGPACGRVGYTPLAVIHPLFATAARWNDYVKREASPEWQWSGAPCPPGSMRETDCAEAGELLEVTGAGRDSCAGLSAHDALGALRFACDDSTGTALFYSTGLAPGRGLGDLVNATGFLPNAVSIEDGQGHVIAATGTSVFWDNPVMPLPDNSAAGAAVSILDVPGAVYVLDHSRATEGYHIAADRISVVTLGGATLGLVPGAPDNCNILTGTPEAPVPPATDPRVYRRCLVSADGARQLWIEGRFDGFDPMVARHDTYVTAVYLHDSFRSEMRRLRAQNGAYGLIMYGGGTTLVYDVRIANASRYGIIFSNTFADPPPSPPGVTGNVVSDVVLSGDGQTTFEGSTALLLENNEKDDTITDLLVAHAAPVGVQFYGDGNEADVIAHTTVAGAQLGMGIDGSSHLVVGQTVIANSTGQSLALMGVTDSDFGEMAMDRSGGDAISVTGASANDALFADVRVGAVGGGTCTGCTFGGPGRLLSGLDLSSTFVGRVTSDGTNPSHGDGRLRCRRGLARLRHALPRVRPRCTVHPRPRRPDALRGDVSDSGLPPARERRGPARLERGALRGGRRLFRPEWEATSRSSRPSTAGPS